MEKFTKEETDFINFYLKRIKQSYSKEKEWYITKSDVQTHFKLEPKKFKTKCADLDRRIAQITDKEFDGLFKTFTDVKKSDLSIFLRSC